MAVIIKPNGEVYIDGKRATWPRDCQYSPAPPLWGLTPSGNFVPIKVKEDGTLEIDVDEITVGAVTIKDPITGDQANVGPDGDKNALYIQSNSLAQQPKESFLEYNKITTIAKNAITTVLTHTVSTKDLWLDGFVADGQVDAEYSLYINTVKKLHCRALVGETAKVMFPTAQKISVGSIIDLKVIHWFNSVSDFEASLIGHKY